MDKSGSQWVLSQNLFFPSLSSPPSTSPLLLPALWKCSLHPPHAFNPGIRRVQPSWKFPKMIALSPPECFISAQCGSQPVNQREAGLQVCWVPCRPGAWSCWSARWPLTSLSATLYLSFLNGTMIREGSLQLLLALVFKILNSVLINIDICKPLFLLHVATIWIII